MSVWGWTLLVGVLGIVAFVAAAVSELFAPVGVRTFVTMLLVSIGAFLAVATLILGSFAVRA